MSDHTQRRQGLGIAAGAEASVGVEPRGSRESFDALADLFLGGCQPAQREEPEPPALRFPGVAAARPEPQDRDQPSPPPPPAATGMVPPAPRRRTPRGSPGDVVLLVAGHLPVMGTAWVNQYARSAAGSAGGIVALIRERGGETTIELVGPVDALPDVDECSTLEEGLRLAGEWAERWLVQAYDPCASAPGLAGAAVLTGADDAAVVGCYRTLKQLNVPATLPVRVTVMGATEERAEATEAKIARAAGEFMGRELEFDEPMLRIGMSPGDVAMGSCALFRGAADEGGATLVEAVVAQARRTRPAARPAADGARTREGVDRASGFKGTTLREIERAPIQAAAPAGGAAEPTRAALTGLVYGLRAVRVRCPVAEGVELAVDEGGRLHLLAGGASAAESLKALTAASAWARLNAELVRAADPGVERLDGATEPVLHLVTEEPRQALRLLDSPVKVHVLVPPSAGPVVRALN